jgi:hypothetical protein
MDSSLSPRIMCLLISNLRRSATVVKKDMYKGPLVFLEGDQFGVVGMVRADMLGLEVVSKVMVYKVGVWRKREEVVGVVEG